jgi:hypothetical protein
VGLLRRAVREGLRQGQVPHPAVTAPQRRGRRWQVLGGRAGPPDPPQRQVAQVAGVRW